MVKADGAVYIYGLRCPIINQIRYIGKTTRPDNRLYLHLFAARHNYYKHHTSRWLRLLQRRGLQPSFEILCRVPDGEDWQDYERRFIAEARAAGAFLTNQTNGGEGVAFSSEEDFDRAKAARKAGYTPEVRARAAERMRIKWADPEFRTRNIKRQKEVANTPERRRHLIRISRKGRTPDGERRRIEAVQQSFKMRHRTRTSNPLQTQFAFD